MNKEKKNLAESVLHRLKNQAKSTHRRTDELLGYYAIERFLYRLSLSPHADKFFLKGGLMLKAWEISNHRATLDIDLLGKTKNSIQNLKEIINDISKSEVVADGIHYETTSLKLTEMQVNGEYHGLRALFNANMHSAKIPMERIEGWEIGREDFIEKCYISGVHKKRGIIQEYLVKEGSKENWISKEEAIKLTLEGRLDATVVHLKNGTNYLRPEYGLKFSS